MKTRTKTFTYTQDKSNNFYDITTLDARINTVKNKQSSHIFHQKIKDMAACCGILSKQLGMNMKLVVKMPNIPNYKYTSIKKISK